ncbi:MAG: hypothetical protein IJQ50_01180 [Clostridia bacterium]|nr:hypothetical protein [Clostridia bacterium]
MNKKFISILIVLLMTASVCLAASGDYAGNYYFTDIKTYVRGQLIDSYNIGGKTVICCENLTDYGFNVYWNGTERTLSITDNKGKAVSNASIPAETGTLGDIAGSYLHTDIKTFFAGKEIESYNISGQTVFPATLLRDFGYEVIWDEENRRVLIDTDKNTFVVGSVNINNLKEKANQTYHGTYLIVNNSASFNGTYPVTSHDCIIKTTLDKLSYIPFQAFADCLGISYTWDSETSTLNVSVPDDSIIKAKESKANPSYEIYGQIEYDIKDIEFNIVNGEDIYKDVKAISYGDEVFIEANDLASAFKFYCFKETDFYTAQMAYLLYSGIYKF